MKGFIMLEKSGEPYLLSLNAIASVSAYREQTRIVLLTNDKNGAPETIFVKPAFEEVVKLIELAA